MKLRVSRSTFSAASLGALALCVAACAGSAPKVVEPAPPVVAVPERIVVEPQPKFTQVGLASWYGPGFHRKMTASGERFDMNDLTAAHRALPLDSVVRVTNLNNGRSVVVRINDRGPYVRGRVIDLSRGAARLLDMKEDGVAPVLIEAVDSGRYETVAASDRPQRHQWGEQR